MYDEKTKTWVGEPPKDKPRRFNESLGVWETVDEVVDEAPVKKAKKKVKKK